MKCGLLTIGFAVLTVVGIVGTAVYINGVEDLTLKIMIHLMTAG